MVDKTGKKGFLGGVANAASNVEQQDAATSQSNYIQQFLSELDSVQDWTDSLNFKVNTKQWSNQFKLDNLNTRFFHITEISAEDEIILRQDLENVISCIHDQRYSWVYYLSGTPQGVEIYIGIVSTDHTADVHTYAQLLESQITGNLTGVKLNSIKENELNSKILNPLKRARHIGLVHGVPSRTLDQQASSAGKYVSQGIDRLARGLIGEEWQMVIVAEPATETEISQQIDQLLRLVSDLHPSVKSSQQKGVNVGLSHADTKGDSTGHTITTTEGTSDSVTKQDGKSDSVTKQDGKSDSTAKQQGTSASEQTGNSKSSNSSSSSTGTSDNKTTGNSTSTTKTAGTSDSTSKTAGTSDSTSKTAGKSDGKSVAKTEGLSTSITATSTNGTSETKSFEYLDKKIERIHKYLGEKLLERLELGRAKGLFRTAVYLSAPNANTFERLSRAMVATFQGNQSHFSPLKVSRVQIDPEQVDCLFKIQYRKQLFGQLSALAQSTPYHAKQSNFAAATWLNAAELSLLAGLPQREVVGLRLRKNVDFAVNPINPVNGFELGSVIQNGRELKSCPVKLDKQLLKQHIFISGVTGAGKTTTCQQILLQSKLPFVVIEPAKTEYRSLHQQDADIEFYTLGNEKISPFRFNPFELLPSESLSGHIDTLKATFAAVFPMEASMPYLIEEAIVRSYELKGWDIHQTENYLFDDPWKSQGQCWPIISEMLEVLKQVIENKNFGLDLQQKYEGSLISRLDNLTVGVKGRMLNTRNSIDIVALLDKKVVIELEDLRDEQDKSLMMGLLIGRIAEAVKHRHKQQHGFQHLMLIEEAHRLLAKPQGDDGAKRMGVDLFANLLAEVRKYGQGIIIADQIPNKLAPEVLKNTNTKIIHRLFAADDRHAIGETVGLDDEQKHYLTMLDAGEAIVYSAGWHGSVRVKINKINDTNAKVIDESVIADSSRQRIFNQREHLYPYLCHTLYGITQWRSAEQFNQFIQQGMRCINLWIKWFHEPKNPSIRQHLQRNMAILQQDYSDNMPPDSLNSNMALVLLFQDVVPISSFKPIFVDNITLVDALIALFLLVDQLPEEIGASGMVFGIQGRDIYSGLNIIFEKLHSI